MSAATRSEDRGWAVATYPFGPDWSERTSSRATTVGIVMRTRERPLLLSRALDSVVSQTFDGWHLVVVNHGGEPGPVEAAVDRIAGSARGKLEVLHLDADGGMERASNAGLARLDAEFVAIHDDDDTWLPRFLEATVGYLADPANSRCGAVVTHAVKRWERMQGDDIEIVDDEGLNTDEQFVDSQSLFGWNRFLPINFLVRSDVFDLIGPFNEHLPVIGDWEFHLRVAAVTEIGLLPEVLARYHLRVEGGDAEYDNTITASLDRHLATDAQLRSALLRRYLDADASRLVLLFALSHDTEMSRRHRDRIEEVVRLIDWRTHHSGNAINDMHDRIVRMETALGEVRADTARIRKAMAMVGLPARPFRLARLRWQRRRASGQRVDGEGGDPVA